VLAVNSALPARMVVELIPFVKARPQKFRYASSGIGAMAHLAMALFKNRAGVSEPLRSPVLPEVPTVAEAGLPGYEATQW
jgi:tripartite-type tricarboxylate transporter receptor subunit TctC